jgi:hypothetical protein
VGREGTGKACSTAHCGGGFKGYDKLKGQYPGGALCCLGVRWWWRPWRNHSVKIQPWLAVDGPMYERGVSLLCGAKVHQGHVYEVRVCVCVLVECRGASSTHVTDRARCVDVPSGSTVRACLKRQVVSQRVETSRKVCTQVQQFVVDSGNLEGKGRGL